MRVPTSPWLDWNGRRLHFRATVESGRFELRIDGIAFERFESGGDEIVREFAYSASGNIEMEFSLADANGALLSAPWRVRYGHAARESADDAPRIRRPMRAVGEALPAPALRANVVIVVPIFNAAALTRRCIESVIRWTTAPAHLVLIDDASTESDVADLLSEYANRAGISIVRNAANLGYTRSSNLGIEAAGEADVVLLNSDTQVGPRWLDRLRQVAHASADTGTVTAVSDNAGAFSVPELENFCPIPSRWSLEETQRALLQNVSNVRPELPTGNGFCMYIRRDMLDCVGLLDAVAFPSGYGEENDLCQRGERAGFRHVIAGDVLVAHARSASFGDSRRAALGAQGMAVLRERYPDYETKVGATLFSFARRVLDYRVRRIYAGVDADGRKPHPRTLLVGDTRITSHDVYASIADGRLECTNGGERIAIENAMRDCDLRAWLLDHAIESVMTAIDGSDVAEIKRAAHDVGIPFVIGLPTGADIQLRYDNAWNSVAAFRSV